MCTCAIEHAPRLVVVTGGPGGGKTALLEVAQRLLCRHVIVLPEAASILWRGQFPRHATLPGRRAAQRAIVGLQLEMQRMTIEEGHAALILCDRGTLDGLAYWPGTERAYFEDTHTTKERELARYAAVIHLQTPGLEHGYLPSPLRLESAAEAAAIDIRIGEAWSGHPRRFVVESDDDFVRKLQRAIDLIAAEVPACCRPRTGSSS
ncbi:MAG TPA: AAA family ATPase [Kofleriaceae bacterium]|nr:AAA family ATPase [Kofleriaceae bacterium]